MHKKGVNYSPFELPLKTNSFKYSQKVHVWKLKIGSRRNVSEYTENNARNARGPDRGISLLYINGI